MVMKTTSNCSPLEEPTNACT